MNTWSEYWSTCAILLGVYVFLRLMLKWSNGLEEREDLFAPERDPCGKSAEESHPINTQPLCARLQEVRRDYRELRTRPSATRKRKLRVEEKRQELALAGYFHPGPPPPPVAEGREFSLYC